MLERHRRDLQIGVMRSLLTAVTAVGWLLAAALAFAQTTTPPSNLTLPGQREPARTIAYRGPSYTEYELNDFSRLLAGYRDGTNRNIVGQRVAVPATFGNRFSAANCFMAWNHARQIGIADVADAMVSGNFSALGRSASFFACVTNARALAPLAEPCPDIRKITEEFSERCLVALLGRVYETRNHTSCNVILAIRVPAGWTRRDPAHNLYARCLVVEHIFLIEENSPLMRQRTIGDLLGGLDRIR